MKAILSTTFFSFIFFLSFIIFITCPSILITKFLIRNFSKQDKDDSEFIILFIVSVFIGSFIATYLLWKNIGHLFIF